MARIIPLPPLMIDTGNRRIRFFLEKKKKSKELCRCVSVC